MTAATTTAVAPGTNASRKALRRLGRGKRAEKLATNTEAASTYFAAKAKRAADKKATFRKRFSKKK